MTLCKVSVNLTKIFCTLQCMYDTVLTLSLIYFLIDTIDLNVLGIVGNNGWDGYVVIMPYFLIFVYKDFECVPRYLK